MSWYSITRQCGHVEEIQIYGTNTGGERERRAQRETTIVCQACREQQRIDQAQADAAQATQLGLPVLTGSLRQVQWAESLRAQALEAVGKLRQEVAEQVARQPEDAEYAEMLYRELDAVFQRRNQASWWIDHRYDLRGAVHDDAQRRIDETTTT